jgi:hypothetical protein
MERSESVLREVGYGARQRGMRQSSAAWATCAALRVVGRETTAEKVNEVLANYGLFRITYLGHPGCWNDRSS